jgi:predicted P-loop ATPase
MADTTSASASPGPSRPPRPRLIQRHFDAIAVSLTKLHRWVLWRRSLTSPTGSKTPPRWTKPPLQRDGSNASTTRAETWCSFTEARRVLRSDDQLDGLGIMLGDLGNGHHLIGFDLDNCITDDAGTLAAWTTPIVNVLSCSYGEYSPSFGGGGVKFLGLCDAKLAAALRPVFRFNPGTWGRKIRLQGSNGATLGHPPAIEVYLGPGRFFTTTGCRYADTAADVVVLAESELRRVAALIPIITTTLLGDDRHKEDRSRRALFLAGLLWRGGGSFDDLEALVRADPIAASWAEQHDGGGSLDRGLKRVWDKSMRDDPRPGSTTAKPHSKLNGGGNGHDKSAFSGHEAAANDNAPSDAPDEDEPIAWADLYTRGKSGPHQTVGNALIALRHDPALSEMLAYDELRGEVVLQHAVPAIEEAEPPASGAFCVRAVTDDDVTGIQVYLQRNGLNSLANHAVRLAVNKRASERAFHPVRDYLDGLRWDGKKRLHGWLTTYCGAAESTYTRQVSRMTLIAMVARVRRPGEKCEYITILEGPQGIEKSKVWQIIGGKWYSDCLPKLDSNDQVRISMHVRGKWLIDIGELVARSRITADELKLFLSRNTERYVPKYGHYEVEEPRQCVFVGTTNKQLYLHDETGNRRDWPIAVKNIDIDGLAEVRDMLFAEADAAFKAGDKWWPSHKMEREHFLPEQEKRYDADPWTDAVEIWIEAYNRSRATTMEAAVGALEMMKGQVDKRVHNRLGAIFQRIGWVPAKRTSGSRGWVPAGSPDADEDDDDDYCRTGER